MDSQTDNEAPLVQIHMNNLDPNEIAMIIAAVLGAFAGCVVAAFIAWALIL
jgi:hypothetical protein